MTDNDKKREELAQEIKAYLSAGGKINQIPSGMSGEKKVVRLSIRRRKPSV